MMRLNGWMLVGTLALAGSAAAQPGPPPKVLLDQEAAALAPLAWMNGRWAGEAWTAGPDGRHKLLHTERAGPMLDGSVKVVEGKAFELDGKPANFNAFAIIAYDSATKTFSFQSHAQGHAGTFPFTITADGYQWTNTMGPVTLTYTAHHEGDTWHEVGMLTRPGAPPMQIFEMTVHRVGDTDWPVVGQMTAPKP